MLEINIVTREEWEEIVREHSNGMRILKYKEPKPANLNL